MGALRGWGTGLALLLVLVLSTGAVAGDAWPRANSRRLGQGQVPVPEVRGLSEAQARAELSRTGLRGRVHQESGPCPDPAAAGLVLRQRPEPGADLPASSWVEITVCPQAPSGRRVEVPNLQGLDEIQAQAALKAAGLRMHVTKRIKCERPERMGKVVCQMPPAGEQARPSQRVGVRVCRGR
ncbi:MAG: PASTA domain-containing protein [Desulfarculus sp.]|nr:PASTA domain-containing protein [Desulfarculus sp.]